MNIHLPINPAINNGGLEGDLDRKQNKLTNPEVLSLFIIFHNARRRPGTVEAHCSHSTGQPRPYCTHD